MLGLNPLDDFDKLVNAISSVGLDQSTRKVADDFDIWRSEVILRDDHALMPDYTLIFECVVRHWAMGPTFSHSTGQPSSAEIRSSAPLSNSGAGLNHSTP